MRIHSYIILLITLLVYGWTMYPGIGGALDSAEFQISGKVLGISHPTGYPLYHLITHLISYIPVSTLALRVTFFSVLSCALAAALIMEILLLFEFRKTFAYLVMGLFVFSLPFWQNGTVTEVYAFQFLIHAIVLLCFFRWMNNPQSGWLIAGGFGVGFGLAHHLMTAILLLGLAVSVWISPPKQKPPVQNQIGAAIAFLIPLLTFLYFPIRALMGAHSFDYYTFTSFSEFVHYMLGGSNTNLLQGSWYWIINNSIGSGVDHFIGYWGVVPSIFAAIGMYEWINQKKPESLILFWLLIVHVFLTGIWTEADREAVLVPALMAGCIFTAVGALSFTTALRQWMRRKWAASSLAVLFLIAVFILQANNTFHTISERNSAQRKYDYDALYEALPEKAVVLSSYWEETNAMKYLAWSGEYPDKDLRVYRWNHDKTRAGVDLVISYLQGKSALGYPPVSPNDRRPVIYLQPLGEDNQSPYLTLQPVPVSDERFIFRAELSSAISKEEKGYIPLSQLPWEVLEWHWMEPRQNLTLNGNPLTIGDAVYQEGYGIHAGTRLRIPVPEGAERFSCVIGVSGDLPQDAPSSIVALLSSENTLLKRSPILGVKTDGWHLNYPLDGEHHLLLEIWGTEDGLNADHAVLAQPRFYFYE